MGLSQTTPIIAPDAQELPPHDLRDRLVPGEKFLWWSPGQGSTFDRGSWAVAAISIGGPLIFMVSIPEMALSWAILLAGGVIVACGLVVLRGIVGARFELYGLTDQRVIFFQGPPLPITLDTGRDGGSAGAIHMLEITGRRERGTIRLQAAFAQHSIWRTRPVRLTGIARPLDVAKLIQSTLDLPVPIEDHTR